MPCAPAGDRPLLQIERFLNGFVGQGPFGCVADETWTRRPFSLLSPVRESELVFGRPEIFGTDLKRIYNNIARPRGYRALLSVVRDATKTELQNESAEEVFAPQRATAVGATPMNRNIFYIIGVIVVIVIVLKVLHVF